jgi:hypothetical protein
MKRSSQSGMKEKVMYRTMQMKMGRIRCDVVNSGGWIKGDWKGMVVYSSPEPRGLKCVPVS